MNGSLIAMGGAVRMDGAAFYEFYQESGGSDAVITILPSASLRVDAGQDYVRGLERLGLKRPARVLPIRQRADADCPGYLQAIRESTGILMGGGDQLRLSAILGGTDLHHAMLDAYQQGTVIGGTSAGTAVLSAMMIASGSSTCLPRRGIARFAPGLGFTSSIIFDQHFRQRNRLGRLIYAVTHNPGMLGVGVDEDTAAVVKDGLLRVTGSTTVTIVDGADISQSNIAEVHGSQPVAVSGIRLHILSQGCTFDLHQSCADIPAAREIWSEPPAIERQQPVHMARAD